MLELGLDSYALQKVDPFYVTENIAPVNYDMQKFGSRHYMP